MRLAFCRRIVAVATVAAITVTAAALARLALLAIVRSLFLTVGTCLDVVRRSGHHRVAGFIRACNHTGMCGIKAVGLCPGGCGCRVAVAAVFTALVAAAIAAFATFTALFTALTTFAPALALAFRTGLAFSVASGVLHGALLARRCVTFVHGCSHGRLVGQCQILLHRVTGRAVGAVAAL